MSQEPIQFTGACSPGIGPGVEGDEEELSLRCSEIRRLALRHLYSFFCGKLISGQGCRATGNWGERVHIENSHTHATPQARRVVSSRQLRARSTTSSEASVKAMTPTADSVSPRWLQ